jgi:hypothetical protein
MRMSLLRIYPALRRSLLAVGLLLAGVPSLQAQDDPGEDRAARIKALMPPDCNEKLQPVMKEPCDKCRFLPCLKNSRDQKLKLIQVYQGLQNFWESRHTDAAGNPMLVQPLASLKEPERSQVYKASRRQLMEYTQMETARTENLGRAEACGYPEKGDLTVSTDTFETCRICMGQLNRAMQAQPCQELADLLLKHETSHAAACAKRMQNYWPYTDVWPSGAKKTTYVPGSILTPAGKAADEIVAYQKEVDALNALIEHLEKKCHPKMDYSSGDRMDDSAPPPPPQPRPPAPGSTPPPPRIPPPTPMPPPKPIS